MVIGLNLCPFAERVFENELIRYVVTEVTEPTLLLQEVAKELQMLASNPRESVETTLIVLPNALPHFLDFNDFTQAADELVGSLGFRGVIQIASFHPEYQFEGTAEDSPENYTNRSPYPILHLLREISITELGVPQEELLQIPEKNIATLKKLGLEKILQRLKGGF